MTNQLYANGPKDGSVIGAPLNGVPKAPLLTPEQAKFDPRQLIWIGSTNRDTQLAYVWHTAPVQSLARPRENRRITHGGTTACERTARLQRWPTRFRPQR